MYNISLLCLTLSSVSRSPLLLIPYQTRKVDLTIQRSIFNMFTTTLLKTYSNNNNFTIKDSKFQNFISTPIILDNNNFGNCYIGDNIAYTHNKALKNENFYRGNFTSNAKEHRLRFVGGCGNIVIAGCLF